FRLSHSLSRHRPPPASTPFPYTTLFRSRGRPHLAVPSRPTDRKCRPPRPPWEGTPERRAARVRRQTARGRDSNSFRRCRETPARSEEHTSELQSRENLVCRLLLEKKK